MPNKELQKHALVFLRKHIAAVLATSSPSGEPQAATLYYDVDDEFNFYFITSKNSQKAINLSANKRASFVVGFGPTVSTIQGFGDVEIVENADIDVFKNIIEKIRLYEFDQLPLAQINKGEFLTVKIKPRWLTWLNLDRVDYPETYHSDFQKVL